MIATILQFTPWKKWSDKDSFDNTKYPGVYAIAMSDDDLSDKPFSLRKDIVYFGMTNSRGGIRSRLDQFDNSLQEPQRTPGHGGADRLKYKHPEYEKTAAQLFVSVFPITCDVKSRTPSDLREMGRVASLEYECLAKYREAFGYEPEFNDRNKSPKKYSLHVNRLSRNS